ncbi:type I-C CRISPR-associated protein Cas8c/Csd1 [Faecalibacterium prausnitzii]|uniref:CRISPR-associated protein Cas8c/Csd1, subtype I-C/DVULG n=1 Tax=Faecalibacterium prausnitzii TaxID=853 RepID=A0A173QT95_9FIRM|nr:type I-C CRISPR-associated protein Cas8c/Csd1 [Faecalibacterium prausnitzii]CUM68793.1 CRISPR-associated protein Cas8c/Csd1%2C subtype I-C/DVULG [Faecalibacterium prausnitzii]
MILQALTAYYEQLVRLGKLSAPGWDDSFKVSYELRLNDAGQLLRVVSLLTEKTVGKKTVLAPRAMRVPAHEKRSSGIAANFLCDNSTYLLGADEKGKPERSADCFKACAKLHHTILDGVDSPPARALLAYFDSWDPAQAAAHPLLAEQWKEITGNANLIFGYEAADHSHSFVNDDPAIQNAWQTHYNDRSADSDMGQCLITGKYAPIERTHPNISGVPGAQSSGAALVSFNAPAFCSYGHEQGDNAPVSKYAAFAYTTALNRLLADRSHCKHVGDTTILCWAENAEPVYQDAMSMFLFGANEATGIQESDVQAALKRLSAGQTVPFLEKELSPDQHFYLLGLAPNAARLSVRFFLRDTFGSFAQNLQKHAEEMEIDCSEKEKFRTLPIWAVVNETTRTVPGQPAKPSPQLAGDLLRAVLTGGRYPATLLNGVTLRIRAEQTVTRGRAAVIKAYYLRNYPTELNKEVYTVSLNETTNVPYLLGRLFSVLEAVQKAANPGINTTIKDRYFNAACATPGMSFPTLLRLSQKHLRKLNDGLATHYDKQITELMAQLPESGFPARLSLPDQGKFTIGYYHQTQKRYVKKNEEE